VLADQQALDREMLARLLSDHPAVTVVAEVSSQIELVALFPRLQADAVLMNWSMTGALEIVRFIQESHLMPAVVLHEMPDSEDDLARALAAGIRGIAGRDTDIDGLVELLSSAVAGGVHVSPDLTPLVARIHSRVVEAPRPAGLAGTDRPTAREIEVLTLLADGRSNRAIASALGLSEHTVRAHLRGLSRKLGTDNRVQTVQQALRLGLLVPREPAGEAAQQQEASNSRRRRSARAALNGRERSSDG
jgi:DNA-binding NarL/FixJ family response regulator